MRRQQDDEGKVEKKKPSIEVEFEVQKVESDLSSPVHRESHAKEATNAEIASLTAKVDTLTKICKVLVVLVALNLLLSIHQSYEL